MWGTNYSLIQYGKNISSKIVPPVGVRSVGRKGGNPPRLENFQGKLYFQGKKSWMMKNISIQWKISGQLWFSAQEQSCSKIVNDKKCTFNKVNSGHTVFFTTNASCSKILNDKKYIQYSENFRGKLCFSRRAQSCSKILNGEKYIQYSEIFQGKLCFSWQAQVAKKSWIIKNIGYSIQCIQCTVYSLGGDPCNLG